MAAAILAPSEVGWPNLGANSARFLENRFGEVEWQIVLAQHRKHIHAFLTGRSQDLDDFPLGIRVAGFPLLQLNDYFVANTGGTAHITRLRHINVMRHPRIIWNHEQKLPAALQCPYDL